MKEQKQKTPEEIRHAQYGRGWNDAQLGRALDKFEAPIMYLIGYGDACRGLDAPRYLPPVDHQRPSEVRS
jgi:hypothetical protein